MTSHNASATDAAILAREHLNAAIDANELFILLVADADGGSMKVITNCPISAAHELRGILNEVGERVSSAYAN